MFITRTHIHPTTHSPDLLQQQNPHPSIVQSLRADDITGSLEKQILRWNIYYTGVFNT